MRFEEMRHGLLKPVLATFYHWASPAEYAPLSRLTKDAISNDKPFYVSDDIYTWASPWLKGCKLYAVDVLIKKPFPLFEQFIPRELMTGAEGNIIDAAEGFDCVIYTPHAYGRGTREMALMYPKDQIKSIRPMQYSHSDLEAATDTNAWNWTCLMGWHDDPKIPPWEDHQQDPLTSDIRAYNAKSPDDPVKQSEFHAFMEHMLRLMKEINEDLDGGDGSNLSPETVRMAIRDQKQARMTSATDRFCYDERVAFVNTFGEHLQNQQASAAKAWDKTLAEDEVIVNGRVWDFNKLLSELLYQMATDEAIMRALYDDKMEIDVLKPLGEDTDLIRHQLRQKHFPDDNQRRQDLLNAGVDPEVADLQIQKASKVKPVSEEPVRLHAQVMPKLDALEPVRKKLGENLFKTGIDALQFAAKANRAALIESMPDAFKAQQKAAAEKEGLTLDDDQIIIGGWVYTWEHGIEEIIDALQNDEAARSTLEGYVFQVGDVDVGLF